MAKKKNNDNDGGLTDMIYDMTGIESHFMLMGLGVLIIIIIACLFYFNMIPDFDFDSIIKSITSSVAAPSAATTPSAAAPSAATTPAAPAAVAAAAAPAAPAAVAAAAAPAKFINNTNIPPSVGSLTMPQQPYVTNTSFNQLTPPPSLKGGLRNSRMR